MEGAVRNEFFIISDITGYTVFLTQSELDHAQGILQALFESQLSHVHPPMAVSNFQGDAIFMHIRQDAVLQEQTLLECIEGIYFAFARQLELMRMNTTCTCRACANIGGLDLKLFVHYGQCISQIVGGKEELIGPDVILVHRMLKNRVAEATGVRAYALFTRTAADALHLHEYCDELIEYAEEYEHVGQVGMLVYPIEKAWQRERQRQRLIVGKDRAWLEFEDTLSAFPAVIWDYLTRMDLKTAWMGVDVEERTDDLGGRNGEGSSYHCAHGGMHVYYGVLDWEPMHHVTFRQKFPGLPEVLVTYLLEPIGASATRFSARATRPVGELPDGVQESLQEGFDGYFSGLKPAVEEHLKQA
jgi:uncharacterized protein YndB with AHSA1/START domain